ncbi:hypothetical protein HYU14_07325 [Candidatus Woesearchaeota archaeon]|nr:hypothetical protein [Candidatus Woesearchaeota archaeon]
MISYGFPNRWGSRYINLLSGKNDQKAREREVELIAAERDGNEMGS